MSINKKIR